MTPLLLTYHLALKFAKLSLHHSEIQRELHLVHSMPVSTHHSQEKEVSQPYKPLFLNVPRNTAQCKERLPQLKVSPHSISYRSRLPSLKFETPHFGDPVESGDHRSTRPTAG